MFPVPSALPPRLPDQPLDQSPAALYLSRLSAGSRRVMRIALERIVADVAPEHSILTFPWQGLDYRHTTAIRTALGDTYSPATANQRLSALKGVLKETWRLGLVPAEVYARAVDLAPIRGSREQRGRRIAARDVTALLATCDDTPRGRRDAAIIAVLRVTGIRRAELVGLTRAAYQADDRALRVLGKGNKERIVFLHDDAAARLDRWLTHCPEGPLFVAVHGARVADRALTDQAVQQILHARCRRAGVDLMDPHDFRRTFCSDLLDAGVDIATVQKMMGHDDISTTARYDRRGDAAKRAALRYLSL